MLIQLPKFMLFSKQPFIIGTTTHQFRIIINAFFDRKSSIFIFGKIVVDYVVKNKIIDRADIFGVVGNKFNKNISRKQLNYAKYYQ
jgi:hypothetical protein